MKSHSEKFRLALGVLLALSIVAGSFRVYQTWASSETDYSIVYSPSPFKLAVNETANVEVIVQNVSPETWEGDELRLGTVYTAGDKNRPSLWMGKDWLTPTRIGASSFNDTRPLRRAEFSFQIQAPSYEGFYKEYEMFSVDLMEKE